MLPSPCRLHLSNSCLSIVIFVVHSFNSGSNHRQTIYNLNNASNAENQFVCPQKKGIIFHLTIINVLITLVSLFRRTLHKTYNRRPLHKAGTGIFQFQLNRVYFLKSKLWLIKNELILKKNLLVFEQSHDSQKDHKSEQYSTKQQNAEPLEKAEESKDQLSKIEACPAKSNTLEAANLAHCKLPVLPQKTN